MSEIVPVSNAGTDVTLGYFNPAGFDLLQRVGMMFNKSNIVPETFRGNLSNCVIAVNMAARMGADPLMVMQNMYIVYGNPAFSSKFLIACFNQSGKFSAIRYEMTGKPGTDEWGCCAYATEKQTGEKLVGPTVTIAIAKAEGWYGKAGSKWKTMPELMLRYRAASQFIKLYAPEISMGMQTKEELEDEFVDLEPAADGSYVVTEEATVDVPEAKKPKAARVAEEIIASGKKEGEGLL